MKPSDILLQKLHTIRKMDTTSSWEFCMISAIASFLDDEYQKQNSTKATSEDLEGDRIRAEVLKNGYTPKYVPTVKTLEEVLAVVTSLKDTSFGQMEDAKKRNEGYLFGLLDATNAIKQLYNQQ